MKPSIFLDEGLIVETDNEGNVRVATHFAGAGGAAAPCVRAEVLNLDPAAAEWLASALLNHARVARAERRAAARDVR